MIALTAAALASLAIVTQDQSALRAAPRDSAQQQAMLWQGDVLEVRGQRMDYLQVYDHRRERAGYIRASQVRGTDASAPEAPDLLAVLRFLRDTPGSESLGLAYAAAYLKAVPAPALTAEPFDAIGSMAERLAARASARQGKANDAATAGQLEVVAGYGVRLLSYETSPGQMQLCYDGEAFRRVLTMPSATPEQRARAALSLSRPDCVDPAMRVSERDALLRWNAELLDRIPAEALPETLKNRLHMRRAGVWSALAFNQARQGEAPQQAGQRALQELAAVNKPELTDDDQSEYNDAAMRVAASRWAAEPAQASMPGGKLTLTTQAGQPGETCVSLGDGKSAKPLARRCTFGVVWAASARPNAAGTALALAVQPLPGWRELWLFHQTPQGWQVDMLPPAAANPELGYVEFAGWVPDGERLLVSRELRSEGRWKRTFEVLKLDTLETEKAAGSPSFLALFQRWQSADWKRQTVSLR